MPNPYQPPQEQQVEVRRRQQTAGNIFITLGAVAPLLGAMGTVIAMIVAFDQMANESAATPDKLADSISLASLSTIAGIAIGAVLFAVGIFVKRASRR